MFIVDDYIINADAKVILNKYDEVGNLCSLVLEDNKVYKVNASPLSVVENSIKYYGYSLIGAIEGARAALGNIDMPPVMISAKLGIYWFPIKAIEHDDNIWIALNHIKDYYSVDKKTVKVIFRDGTDIKIECSYGSFERKVNRVHKFKNIMESRTNNKYLYFYKKSWDYQIVRDPARKHYIYVMRNKNRKYLRYKG